MTSSFPDSISTDMLESLQENAPAEDTTPLNKKHWEKEDYIRIAEEIDEKIEEYCDPMVDKMVIMSRLQRLMAFHSESSVEIDSDTEDSAIAKLCWARDAGKLQAMMCIIDGISMGAQDWLCTE